MVRELFEMARSKKACLIFFDEIDAIGGARFDDGAGGDNEVQRTMLELINQLDGFDPRGNIKVLMATNRPDTLDPALMRPGRLDRKVEFGLPDLEGRTHIFNIHARAMSVERDIRFELLARLCPNSTGNVYIYIYIYVYSKSSIRRNFGKTETLVIQKISFVLFFKFHCFEPRQNENPVNKEKLYGPKRFHLIEVLLNNVFLYGYTLVQLSNNPIFYVK